MSKTKKSSSGQTPDKAGLDNRAEQLNPVSVKFWRARGYEQRPENWETLLESEQPPKQGE